MSMRFSVHTSARNIRDAVRFARLAEDLGYTGIFFAESPPTCPDAFQLMAVCAGETKRLKLGNAVTNMIYRDPFVLANSAATLNEISQGRAILGLATGDGAAYMLGRKATPIAEFEGGLKVIHELLQGRSIPVPRGKELKGDASVPLRVGKLPVPVYVSAEGPRILRVSGKFADGVILGTGFDPRVLEWSRARLAEGAAETGRAADEIELLVAGMIYVDDDGERARNIVRSRLANRAHHNFRFTLETVPPEELAGVKKFMDAFDMSKPLEEKVDAALVTPYLIQRFSIAGTPEECIARVRELEKAGVKHLMLTPPQKAFTDMLPVWSRKIMPSFA
jgi:5,10-methylenetetrahydromethanopterin reductase